MGILRIVASVTARQITALPSRDQGADFYHGLPDHLYPRPLRPARSVALDGAGQANNQ